MYTHIHIHVALTTHFEVLVYLEATNSRIHNFHLLGNECGVERTINRSFLQITAN
jgi:hypothetical protein